MPGTGTGAGASVQATRADGQLILEKIGDETYEDPVLSQLRDEVLEGRTGDIEMSLIRMRSPWSAIKQTKFGSSSCPEYKTNSSIGVRGGSDRQ